MAMGKITEKSTWGHWFREIILVPCWNWSLIENWNNLNSKVKSVRIIETLGINTSSYLSTQIRILALMTCGKSYLLVRWVPQHNFGVLKFLRSMIGVQTLSWSLWKGTQGSSRELRNWVLNSLRIVICIDKHPEESVATSLSLFLWWHHSLKQECFCTESHW